MIDPTPLPGLAGRTVVVTGAAHPFATATARTLLASGATVIAVDNAATLPAALVDAGTGLPGVLHYRPVDAGGWPAVCDWIGEHAAGLHGVADHAGDDEAVTALLPHLLEGASIVGIGDRVPTISGERSMRLNAVNPHRDADALAVAAAVTFLLSNQARGVHDSVLACRAAPPDAV